MNPFTYINRCRVCYSVSEIHEQNPDENCSFCNAWTASITKCRVLYKASKICEENPTEKYSLYNALIRLTISGNAKCTTNCGKLLNRTVLGIIRLGARHSLMSPNAKFATEWAKYHEQNRAWNYAFYHTHAFLSGYADLTTNWGKYMDRAVLRIIHFVMRYWSMSRNVESVCKSGKWLTGSLVNTSCVTCDIKSGVELQICSTDDS